MKKINILIIFVIIMTLFTGMTAFAGSKASKITVTVNSKKVEYKVSPYIKNNEVMIPLRQTAEALGATVRWDKKSKTAWLDVDMMHFEFIVGKSEFYIHRDADFSGIPETVKIKSPIKNVGGRVFVPGVTVFERVGAKVSWDSKKKVLSITSATAVSYEEIMADSIRDNSTLMKWYDENNQKLGISYIREGKYIYALIGGGERPTGGFTITLDEVSYSTPDIINIYAKVTPPGDNVRVMMVITYPSMLIRIKSDTVKSIVGEVIDTDTSKEKWITLDLVTVSKMELFSLDEVKLRDLTKREIEMVIQAFNEATLDHNGYIKMIAGNILRVTTTDGYIISFSSYGSETNVIANIAKDDDVRTFHLVAPKVAELLLKR